MHDWTCPDFRRPVSNSTFVPQEDCEGPRWYLSHCVPGREHQPPRHRQRITSHPMKGCSENHQIAAFIWLVIFPEFQTPYQLFSWIPNPLPTRFFSLKKVSLRWAGRQYLGWITHHLLRSLAIWIKCHKDSASSLLIGSVSDRLHEHQLFWFQYWMIPNQFSEAQ